jgi:hypothetical protein
MHFSDYYSKLHEQLQVDEEDGVLLLVVTV